MTGHYWITGAERAMAAATAALIIGAVGLLVAGLRLAGAPRWL